MGNGGEKGEEQRGAAWAWAAMGIAILLIFRRLVWGRVLAGGDLHTYFFPYWVTAARAFQAGQLPLWNPYLFAGAPLLANSQAGVFYPLNWPLWLLSGPSLAGMARALHWSVLLHLLLAASNAWLLARRLGATPWGAAISGLLYAGSGYLGLHVEHLNQLHALAWLPLTLLPCKWQMADDEGRADSTIHNPSSEVFLPPVSVVALALILLAGHTQMAFIAAVGIALWRVGEARGALTRLWQMAWPYALAFGMAAVQLAPTLALTRHSVRSGGMPWREAISFSVPPWELPRALLPPYLLPPLLPEGVAYLGLVGLVLAGWAALRAPRREGRALRLPLALAGLGLFLALGGYNPLYLAAVRLGVPGFVHFRAPARFLALYTLGASLAAGLVMTDRFFTTETQRTQEATQKSDFFRIQPITNRRFARGKTTYSIAILKNRIFKRSFLRGVLFAALALELLWAAEGLPHAAATASRAYTDLRPATAHLMAAAEEPDASPGRFLSVSQTLFDVGDGPEIDAIYGDALSADALWTFKVAAKQREVLAPNISMAFGVPALDGYDGGLLPTEAYVAFSRLLLPGGTRDGRLRENLVAIPDARWLALAGTRFVIPDKVGDAWLDGVFYDRQFRHALEPGESLRLAWLPEAFAADALGLLYAGEGAVTVAFAEGDAVTLPLPLAAGDALTPGRARWPEPGGAVRAVTFHGGDAGLVIGGVSLLDETTDAFYPLVASAHFRQVHSGDVKIYENLAVLPRAFLVPSADCAADEATALAKMQSPGFDPARQAVLLGCADAVLPDGTVTGEARVTRYAAARVDIEAETAQRALLLLTDGWSPGWRAQVEAADGSAAFEAEPLRANLLFRGVLLEPGAWRVTWRYRPEGLTAGAVISGMSLLAWALYRPLRSWLAGPDEAPT